jgi:hypothetical protein
VAVAEDLQAQVLMVFQEVQAVAYHHQILLFKQVVQELQDKVIMVVVDLMVLMYQEQVVAEQAQ